MAAKRTGEIPMIQLKTYNNLHPYDQETIQILWCMAFMVLFVTLGIGCILKGNKISTVCDSWNTCSTISQAQEFWAGCTAICFLVAFIFGMFAGFIRFGDVRSDL